MKITIDNLKDKKIRKKLFRYWFLDPVFGTGELLMHFALRLAPLSVNAWIGDKVGRLAFNSYLTNEAARARHNFSVLKPELTKAEVDKLLGDMWGNIGQSLCEYSILDKLWRHGRVIVDDSRAIDYIKPGKPIILVGVHLGNWEAACYYLEEKDVSLMAVYRPPRNRFTRWVVEMARKRLKVITVPSDEQPMRKMFKHLKSNGALWLAIDDFKNSQVHFPRFGRPMPPKGINATHIIRLAQHFDAAVIPVQVIRTNKPAPSFEVIAHTPVFLADKSEAAAAECLHTLDKMIEGWIMERPEQWFMMHDLRL